MGQTQEQPRKEPRSCWHWVVCAELAGTALHTAPALLAWWRDCWVGLTAGPGASGAQCLSWAPVATPGVSASASFQVTITQGGNLHPLGLSFLLCQPHRLGVRPEWHAGLLGTEVSYREVQAGCYLNYMETVRWSENVPTLWYSPPRQPPPSPSLPLPSSCLSPCMMRLSLTRTCTHKHLHTLMCIFCSKCFQLCIGEHTLLSACLPHLSHSLRFHWNTPRVCLSSKHLKWMSLAVVIDRTHFGTVVRLAVLYFG